MADAAAYEFGDRFTAVVDLKNPLSYLALAPTFALADELGVETRWLPMEHSGSMPPPAPSDDRGSEHRRMRASYRAHDVMRYARARGLDIRNLYRTTHSAHAGAGLLAASAHSHAALRSYLEQVCERHWNETLDLEDAAAIEKLLGECGVANPSLSGWRAEYDALQVSLAATGLFTTPAYVVGGEVFYGRAHLPMVRQLLSDGLGAASS